jgi:hypothetical protein
MHNICVASNCAVLWIDTGYVPQFFNNCSFFLKIADLKRIANSLSKTFIYFCYKRNYPQFEKSLSTRPESCQRRGGDVMFAEVKESGAELSVVPAGGCSRGIEPVVGDCLHFGLIPYMGTCRIGYLK